MWTTALKIQRSLSLPDGEGVNLHMKTKPLRGNTLSFCFDSIKKLKEQNKMGVYLHGCLLAAVSLVGRNCIERRTQNDFLPSANELLPLQNMFLPT